MGIKGRGSHASIMYRPHRLKKKKRCLKVFFESISLSNTYDGDHIVLGTSWCNSGRKLFHFIQRTTYHCRVGLLWHQTLLTKSSTQWCISCLVQSDPEALTDNWPLSRSFREGCTSSSSLTRTPPVGCVCSLWPYLSPYVSDGCMVRCKPQCLEISCLVLNPSPCHTFQ